MPPRQATVLPRPPGGRCGCEQCRNQSEGAAQSKRGWRCEELPGGAEHGRRFAASGCGVGPQVLRPRLPVVSFRFAADLRCRPSEGEFGIWHAHHLVSDAVRLMLKWIVNLSDNELPL